MLRKLLREEGLANEGLYPANSGLLTTQFAGRPEQAPD